MDITESGRKSLRILHINSNYIYSDLHRLMIRELDKVGYDNHVFVPCYDKNLSIVPEEKNVKYVECFKKWDRVLFDYKQNRIIKTIESTYDISKFDIIHAYTLFTDGNCARELSKKYGVPYVVAVRNTDVNYFYKYMIHLRKRGEEILSQAKAVFFLSETYRKTVLEKYVSRDKQSIINRKSYIIPNGINDYWIESMVNNDIVPEKKSVHAPVRLLYVGGIDKNKNIEMIQKSMDVLKKRGTNTELLFVGKIVDHGVYKRLIKHTMSKYHEPCNKEELRELYKSSDIFIMPSLRESFGLVYAEALSCGIPVLYTQGQGFDGQFKEGEVGYHIDPLSPVSIADAIQSVIDNYSPLVNKTAKAAKTFQWSTIVKKYSEIYSSVGER